jgi:hypothetical protein
VLEAALLLQLAAGGSIDAACVFHAVLEAAACLLVSLLVCMKAKNQSSVITPEAGAGVSAIRHAEHG